MVEPLRSRVLTQEELQKEILSLICRVRSQLNRSPYENGLSDLEFQQQVLDTLELEIRNDIDMLRMKSKHGS